MAGEPTCRLAEVAKSMRFDSANWSIRRASERDRTRLESFRYQGVVMADDRDFAAVRKTDALVVESKLDARDSWIAETGEDIVGFVTLILIGERAHVTALCVVPELHCSALAADLLGHALRFCRDAGILKVVLRTHLSEEDAWSQFDECGYRFDITRLRPEGAQNVLEYYLDLYSEPKCERANS